MNINFAVLVVAITAITAMVLKVRPELLDKLLDLFGRLFHL